jgi:hypothetical protein
VGNHNYIFQGPSGSLNFLEPKSSYSLNSNIQWAIKPFRLGTYMHYIYPSIQIIFQKLFFYSEGGLKTCKSVKTLRLISPQVYNVFSY